MIQACVGEGDWFFSNVQRLISKQSLDDFVTFLNEWGFYSNKDKE